MSLLIFTDLDGSLMEHETYSIEPAKPILKVLESRQIPIVFNSSKTASEIHAIQQELGLCSAYISENGGALYSDSEIREFGKPRDSWLSQIHKLRDDENYSFSGFYDWSPGEISELTGLTPAQAELSKNRHYSEPILWKDSVAAKRQFESQLKQLGLKLLEGGRFLSIQSDFDKSDPMNWMISEKNNTADSDPIISVALGDSPNDEAMLNCATVAVIIKSGKSQQIKVTQADKVIATKRPGPAGWQDAMKEILDLYDSGHLAIKAI